MPVGSIRNVKIKVGSCRNFIFCICMNLLDKLRIDVQLPLWVINIPGNCVGLFHDCIVKKKLGKEKPVGQLVFFATDSRELNHYLPLLGEYIDPQTLFWICYPKQSGAIQSDLV